MMLTYKRAYLYKCEDGFIGEISEIKAHIKSKDRIPLLRSKICRGELSIQSVGERIIRPVFRLYDGKGFEFVGSVDDVSKRFNVKQSTISNSAKMGNRINGKYLCQRIGIEQRDNLYSEHWEGEGEQLYRDAVMVFKKYGNVALGRYGEQIIERMRKEGYKFSVRQTQDIGGFILEND